MKKIPEMTNKQIKRFWSKVNPALDPDRCWDWLGAINHDGYGLVWINGEKFRAIRVAYYLGKGQDLGDLLACHACDRRTCVNPAHLWSGTNLDNIADRVRKNRSRKGKVKS